MHLEAHVVFVKLFKTMEPVGRDVCQAFVSEGCVSALFLLVDQFLDQLLWSRDVSTYFWVLLSQTSFFNNICFFIKVFMTEIFSHAIT